MTTSERKISVIGLGYVGLPLAVAFAKEFPVIGFDIDQKRITDLKNGSDQTDQFSPNQLVLKNLKFTDHFQVLKEANFHIIAVPTPIHPSHQPDLKSILQATKTVAHILKKGDVVVYESTVYPGLTEEECLPLLESESGLKCDLDFKLGYCPERMNPGDQDHTLDKIIKVVSGRDNLALEMIEQTYKKIAKFGIHKAPSIRVAEAAKVIENTQRDLNIALMNELAIIFDKMDIDTQDVLNTASTKWNFHAYKPGLVGGHCIGVDPFYLTHKTEQLGHNPQVILAGRKTNDGMGKFVAERTIKEMMQSGHSVSDSTITILGLTFKENCPDIRNSQVIHILQKLREYGARIQIHDPLAHASDVQKTFGTALTPFDALKPAQAIIVTVAHDFYKKLTIPQFKKLAHDRAVFIDVKSLYEPKELESVGFNVWRL